MFRVMQCLLLAALTTATDAAYTTNLNYGSPSPLHSFLGISIPQVTKRAVDAGYAADQLKFTHGVASGDPFPNSVILWTRAAPSMRSDDSNVTVSGTVPLYDHDTERYVQASNSKVCVRYSISGDEKMKGMVDEGTAYTSSDVDWTVKVEAKNLQPFMQYYYQFNICDSNTRSPPGRTKTAPLPNDDVSNLNLAVFSCANYPNGFFNAYGNAARKDDVDYFVHLGDYIYENGRDDEDDPELISKAGRAVDPPGELTTLYDYRTRIAQYRTDEDLLLGHQRFAWIPVWDDHEIANNGYKDGFSAMNNTEASFNTYGGVSVDQRKMNAIRAYFEWMPIRQIDADDNLRIWRSFQLGKLLDLIMLDTRYYDRSITDLDYNTEYVEGIRDDAGRSLMGSKQENWFYRSLSESRDRGAVWRIIGNQIVFSRINITSWYGSAEEPFNVDQWDGYMANRNRTLQHLYDNKIPNNIMLAGDSHNNWVSDLVWLDEKDYDPVTGANAIGVEFAGTAVTSSGIGGTIADANAVSRTLTRDNEELHFQEGYLRGYFELHVSPKAVHAQYFGTPTVARRVPWEVSLANFTVLAGSNKLQRPIAGGSVENGALQAADGEVAGTNLTRNTETGEWFISHEEQMFIVPDH